MSDEETLRVYAEKVDDYTRIMEDQIDKDPQFAAFLTAVTPAGHVLDLGCGPGLFAARMAEAGLQVTAFDPVPEMVARAASFPGVTAQQAGFDDVGGTDLYDGVWANFSLLHAPRDNMPGHLAALHLALKPNGVLHIGLKTGEGAHRDSLGRLYTYYTQDELTALLRHAGFTVLQITDGEDPGLSGEVAPWVCVLAHA
ncbi:MAG: class I SAM-dependent methyltransferase [Roseobacter sp.]